jgi:flavin reductase (DIM6/NTAB) family NADH-FMN oxidoreductase RutF
MELSTGAPVLSDAVVACDCRVIEIKAVATHNVIFAGVVGVRLGGSGSALVYHERAYKQV